MQRLAIRWRRHGTRVAFVPTMGCLHDGHLRLVRRARQWSGRDGAVVVSIYVNPTQFGPAEDFAKYPRDLARDAQLCREAAVDVLFAPQDGQMYRRGVAPHSTFVIEENLSKPMEGVCRPTHFRGVTTIVAKLFNIVQPDVAIFGAKDWQQAAVIRRMTRDLNFPVRVVVAPTCREHDGLAMSSRNQYLTGRLRGEATALWRAIQEARRIVRRTHEPVPARALKTRLAKLIQREPDARVDYIEGFNPTTLAPLEALRPGDHLALAVRIGGTRLIDNARL
jgi:pantoate--beta-alanine ligase